MSDNEVNEVTPVNGKDKSETATQSAQSETQDLEPPPPPKPPNTPPDHKPDEHCFYCNEHSFAKCETCGVDVCKEHVSSENLNVCAVCAGQAPLRGIYPCSFCTKLTARSCLICHRTFCLGHQSRRDKWMCSDCSSDALPLDELAIDVEIRPLIDDDGVTHKGKHIVPVAGTHISLHYIDTLSDKELEEFLTELKEEIRRTERMLYSKLLAQTTVETSLVERGKARKRSERAESLSRAVSSKQVIAPPRGVSAKSAPALATQDVVAELKAKASTPEGKKAMLELLKGLMKK